MKKYFGILAVSVLLACNNSAKQPENNVDSTSVATDTVAVSAINFKDEKVQEIYSSYIVLKDALVASNFDQTKVAAKALEEQLKTFKGCENTAVIVKNIENAKDIATPVSYTHLDVYKRQGFKLFSLITCSKMFVFGLRNSIK